MPFDAEAMNTEDLLKFIDDCVFTSGTNDEQAAMTELLARIIPATETSAVVETDNRGGVHPKKPSL